MDIDLKMLKDTDLTENVILEIKPYSYLYVHDNSGNNFFSSSVNISKNKILGLLENVTKIHIPKDIKEIILKDLKYNNIKQYHTSNEKTLYLPLIFPIIKINEIIKPKNYKIVFSQIKRKLYRKSDSSFSLTTSYLNDSASYDALYESKILEYFKGEFKDKNIFEKTPDFYGGLKDITYIRTKDSFIVNFNTNKRFFNRLEYCLNNVGDSAFLGDSDSLVTLNLIK
jgi:hypothetical protein